MLPAAEALGRPKPTEWSHNVLALAAMGRGQVDEAIGHFDQSRSLAERSNDQLDLAMAHSNLGIQHQYAGDFARARAELERAIELCREAVAEHRAINTIQRLGWVLLGEGDLRSALRQAEYARVLASRAADRWVADCHDLLGTVAALQADWTTAIDSFEEALRLRERGPHVVGRVETLLGLGLARQRSGDWPGARADFAEALGPPAGSTRARGWSQPVATSGGCSASPATRKARTWSVRRSTWPRRCHARSSTAPRWSRPSRPGSGATIERAPSTRWSGRSRPA